MQIIKVQDRVCYTLPKNMTPDKESFEAIGFTFEDVDKHGTHYQAYLPEGWRIVHATLKIHHLFLDAKKQVRGCYTKEYMQLYSRFSIVTLEDNQFIEFHVYDQVLQKSIFSVGACDQHNYWKHLDLERNAKNFLYHYYPDWQNINKYWD